MNGTFTVDFDGLKKMARDFFALAPDSTGEQLDAGFKCFSIGWMNCTFSDDFLGRVQKEAEHPALLRIVRDEYTRRRVPMVLAADADQATNRGKSWR